MKSSNMKNVTLSTIHWQKYLDETKNPRVKNFLKYRGDDVMWQISQNIHRNGTNGIERLVMVIHENAPYAIDIPKKDYNEVLNLAIKYFEQKESYEKCSEIVKFKSDIINSINKTERKLVKNLI